ncbi:RNA-guided endonuclease InsQ/TnpB family protein [Kyrpidia spormannii]|uniref:Transposase n=2 Tax=Kyrpidia spormannii TaxID=2055160 RepID=A0ACA8Z958_9BACL|nr:RNA-guided endonuclease TnpB family protein [Kyrpidia spormannii]CAB3391308.1 putative transposase [Kyrpidia spormannii]CAB3392219.1 putative transposase [Kyrpidia spormannii]
MKILKSFRFRLEPTTEQSQCLTRYRGCARLVWNKALALQKGRLEAGYPLLSYEELARLLTLWRHSEEYGFLANAPVHPLQWTLKFLDRAIRAAFDKSSPARFPTFKKKNRNEAGLRFPDPKQIKLDLSTKDAEGRCVLPKVFLPKIGWVKFRKSRTIDGTIRNATVTWQAGHWYISFQTEIDVPEPVHPSESAVGIDRGIVHFAALSDGTFVDAPGWFRRHETKLAWEMRKLSRKKRFSRNWQKQKARLQRLHAHIANARRDFLHKTSTAISKTHAMVFVEDLRINNMSRSAKGTRENPGKNVRAKSGLNKAILDQGWFMFQTFLGYKLHWLGGWLGTVPAPYTSQTCPVPECGHKSPANRPRQTTFRCERCGYEGNADTVGAMNILRAGLARIACSPV